MRINGFRCDNCKKERLISPLSSFSSADGAPIGWFAVKNAMLLVGPTWMFCSKECLHQWSTEPQSDCQSVAVEEVSK